MDWLSGFPDAARAAFPETRIQKCTAHMARNSIKFVSRKDLKAARADLKAICRAPSEEAGRVALEEFGEKRRAAYPLIYQSWDSNWPDLCEFFNYPKEIRQVIYTTNTIESLNCQLRKATRNRSALASGEAIYKIMCLALRNAAKNGPCRLRTGRLLSTSLRCFLASGFRSYEFYLHKTIDRPAAYGIYR
jgi:transposase-like protein